MSGDDPHDEDTLTDADLEELEARLRTLRAELRAQLSSSRAGSRPVALDQQAVGRVSRIDAIQQQQMVAATRRLASTRLRLVDAALRGITEGEYGDCRRCEEPIGRKRLNARPEAAVCLGCQAALERTR